MTDNQDLPSVDENKLIAERRAKLSKLREQGPAFPNDFRRNCYCAELQAKYGDKTKEELEAMGLRFSVAGRVVGIRGPFYVIRDMSGSVQLYVNRKTLSTEQLSDIKSWDYGDIVGAEGVLHKSGKGDLYIDMETPRLLTKALRPLPDKWHGLSDVEMKYRRRYVDLIVNEDTRKTFLIRSKIVEGIRHFLTQRDFVEAETPMLQVIPGGATARPFVTYHNSLDIEMFLRIAPELYLKRLVVGGFERVFEINRNFRNEGLSPRHNPEFTMLEFYQAYADYRDLMDLTEEMLRTLAQNVLGTTQVQYQGDTFDFGQSFTRMTMAEAVIKYNQDKPRLIQAVQWLTDRSIREQHRQEIRVRFREACEQLRVAIPIDDPWTHGKYLTEIFEASVETQLAQPTFITAYPRDVSPLARCNDEDPFVTDRFEFFVGGREIANGFSELNDPEDQAERFRRQVLEKKAGDAEAMYYDEDYIIALEHGLPPTAGEGIGIDRLVMLFTDSPSIRDVILFPHMRPQA